MTHVNVQTRRVRAIMKWDLWSPNELHEGTLMLLIFVPKYVRVCFGSEGDDEAARIYE